MKSRENHAEITASPVVYVMVTAYFAFGYARETVCYLVALALHELGHAAAARVLGYSLGGFKLMPYGAALIGETSGASVADEIIIAAAGPLCSLALAVTTAATWWVFPSSHAITSTFGEANFWLLLTNLAPVFPLDGGRIALAAASVKRSRAAAYAKLKIVGYALSGIFAALFFLSLFLGVNFSFATMSAFVLLSASAPFYEGEYECAYKRAYLGERLKKGLVERKILVTEQTSVRRLRRLCSHGAYTVFIVVNDALEPLGTLTETDVGEALSNENAAELAEKVAKNREKCVKI